MCGVPPPTTCLGRSMMPPIISFIACAPPGTAACSLGARVLAGRARAGAARVQCGGRVAHLLGLLVELRLRGLPVGSLHVQRELRVRARRDALATEEPRLPHGNPLARDPCCGGPDGAKHTEHANKVLNVVATNASGTSIVYATLSLPTLGPPAQLAAGTNDQSTRVGNARTRPSMC